MSAPAVEPAPRLSQRTILVALCFAAVFICYVDRVNISLAIIAMKDEFGWDKTTQGWVMSSFFIGYLTTQILGGWLADRYGGKPVLQLPTHRLPVRPMGGDESRALKISRS